MRKKVYVSLNKARMFDLVFFQFVCLSCTVWRSSLVWSSANSVPDQVLIITISNTELYVMNRRIFKWQIPKMMHFFLVSCQNDVHIDGGLWGVCFYVASLVCCYRFRINSSLFIARSDYYCYSRWYLIFKNHRFS